MEAWHKWSFGILWETYNISPPFSENYKNGPCYNFKPNRPFLSLPKTKPIQSTTLSPKPAQSQTNRSQGQTVKGQPPFKHHLIPHLPPVFQQTCLPPPPTFSPTQPPFINILTNPNQPPSSLNELTSSTKLAPFVFGAKKTIKG
jgi:hypothetical protein